MLNLIGLCGKAQSGKNFVGYIIRDQLNFIPWAFAHPMKFAVYAEKDNQWDLPTLFYNQKPLELRHELQQFGTELGRDVHGEDYWVKQAEVFLYLAEHDFKAAGVVLTDVRFPNEAEMIRRHGGIVLKVVAGREQLSEDLKNHRSETLLDDIIPDGFIYNADKPSEAELWEQLIPYALKLGVSPWEV